MGFFTAEEIGQRRVVAGNPRCGACGLSKGCRTPKIPLAGEGGKGILVVGEAPGAEEDRHGKPFIGESGQLLQKALKANGINFFRDCWVTNTVVCRPPENRDPTSDELENCLPNLLKVIQDTNPRVILLAGRFAIAQVIGQSWTASVGSGMRWLGYQIPNMKWNAWLCPVYHPAYIQRKLKGDEVEGLLWRKHLKAMSELYGRPWPGGLPEYGKRIRCLYDSRQAAAAVEDYIRWGAPVAFDYECDRLKPDHEDAQIVSCSVSDGEYAISYPWVGEAVEATKRLLWSTVPKMGWNIKFEERWTRRVFGKGVRNWLWDGMQATHVLDNRQDINSLKFQAFVQLGVSSYNMKMAPFLRADSSNEKNRIREAPLGELLYYGGMDSLCTALIGQRQIERIRGEGNNR